MSDAYPQDQEAHKVALARHVDAICRRFEADWRAGRIPAKSDYLGEIAEEGQGFRAELEALESELRQADEAATALQASLPTAPIPGMARPSVHQDATVAPCDDATVDLGPPGSPQTEASSRAHVRYFGDYEIIREIARGGMGVVFQARQVSLNRPVALKMILAGQLANETDVKRFYTEAEAAANLDHPGIVPIYEVGQHEGQHYFSMGFVEGQSLSQRLADGPLPPARGGRAGESRRGHRICPPAGVIHRDLKPANILLDARQPARHRLRSGQEAGSRQRPDGLGQIMGTPSYMPPEQAGGKRERDRSSGRRVRAGGDPVCPVTGRPPFQAATAMDTVIQVVGDEPVPPRRLNASIPARPGDDLPEMPGERAGQAILQRGGDGRRPAPIPGRRADRGAAGDRRGNAPSSWRGGGRRPRRCWDCVALVTALGLGVCSGSGAPRYTPADLAERRRIAAENAAEAEKAAKIEAQRQQVRAEWLLYASKITLAQRELEANRVDAAAAVLKSTRPDFRSWEYDYLQTQSEPNRILCNAPSIDAISRDGKRLASSDDRRGGWGVTVWDMETGKLLMSLSTQVPCEHWPLAPTARAWCAAAPLPTSVISPPT